MLSSPANFISPCFLLPRLMLYLHVLLFPRLMLYLRVFLLPRLVHILYLLETPVDIFHHCRQENGLLHMVDRVPPPGDEISSPQCSTIGQHQVEHLVQGPSQEGCVQGMWVWSLHSRGVTKSLLRPIGPLTSHWSTYVPLVHLCPHGPHWSISSHWSHLHVYPHWSTYVPIGPFIPLVHLCPHWSTYVPLVHLCPHVLIGPFHPIGPLTCISPLVHLCPHWSIHPIGPLMSPLVHLCPHWSTYVLIGPLMSSLVHLYNLVFPFHTNRMAYS